MSDRYDCSDPEQRAAGLKAAAEAVRRGELIVLLTDTVYGIGAEVFSPAAVTSLLAAKQRGRDMPQYSNSLLGCQRRIQQRTTLYARSIRDTSIFTV